MLSPAGPGPESSPRGRAGSWGGPGQMTPASQADALIPRSSPTCSGSGNGAGAADQQQMQQELQELKQLKK